MDFDRTYDPSEVAELCHVTRRTVYNWITSGLLKAEKVGPRRWIVRGVFLKTFLERGEVKPALAATRSATPIPAVASLAPSLMQSRPGGAVVAKKKKPHR